MSKERVRREGVRVERLEKGCELKQREKRRSASREGESREREGREECE